MAPTRTRKTKDVRQLMKEAGGEHWEEHGDHPIVLWKDDVLEDATRLGYWEWAEAREENGDV